MNRADFLSAYARLYEGAQNILLLSVVKGAAFQHPAENPAGFADHDKIPGLPVPYYALSARRPARVH